MIEKDSGLVTKGPKHHTNPRSILERFANCKGSLKLWDKDGLFKGPTGASVVCQRINLNVLSYGSTVVEKSYSDMESRFGRVLQSNLKDGIFLNDSRSRDLVVDFIKMMSGRSLSLRQHDGLESPRDWTWLSQILGKATGQAHSDFDVDRIVRSKNHVLVRKMMDKYGIPDIRRIATVVAGGSKKFITSDNPVVKANVIELTAMLYKPYTDVSDVTEKAYAEGYSLTSVDLFMPISPDLCLLSLSPASSLALYGPEGTVAKARKGKIELNGGIKFVAPDDIVLYLNRKQMLGAVRDVISHPRVDDINQQSCDSFPNTLLEIENPKGYKVSDLRDDSLPVHMKQFKVEFIGRHPIPIKARKSKAR